MDIDLKSKAEIVTAYLNGKDIVDISGIFDLGRETVEKIIKEWISGYFKVHDDDYYFRQIASLLMENDITIKDLVQGYYYHKIFSGMEKEIVIRFIISLNRLDNETRRSLIDNSEKMMKIKKYTGIDYSEIPSALEGMVNRGKELKKEIEAYQREIEELHKERDNLNEEIKAMENEFRKRSRDLEILFFMEKTLELNHNEIKEFLREIDGQRYSRRDLMEITRALKILRERGMGMEQFIKLVDYLEGIMKMGFTVSMLRDFEKNLEEKGIRPEKYLRELQDTLEEKVKYEEKLDELRKEAKYLENQIRSMRNEVKEYIRKVKPRMK